MLLLLLLHAEVVVFFNNTLLTALRKVRLRENFFDGLVAV